VSAQNLGALHEYDVIVMPSGNYGSVLSDARLDAFKQWIQPQRTPGAIVKVNLNPLSFMSYGVAASFAAQVRSSTICRPFEDNPVRRVGIYAGLDEPRRQTTVAPGIRFWKTSLL